MSDLPRLKDDDDLAGMLLRSADGDAPPPKSRAAISAGIGLSSALGKGTAAMPAATAGKTTIAAKLAGGVALKVTAALVVVGTAIGAHHVITRGDDRAAGLPPRLPAAVIEPRAAREPAKAEPAAEVAAPATAIAVAAPAAPIAVTEQPHAEAAPHALPSSPQVQHAVAAEPSQPPPATPAPASTLREESQILDAALVALRDRDSGGALAALDRYDQRFPAGVLAPEAAVARIDATLLAGDVAKARTLAARFLADHPDSPAAPRVRARMAELPR